MATANLSRAKRIANSVEAVRSDYLTHLDHVPGSALATPQAFSDWADTVLCNVADNDDSVNRALGRNTAYKLFRELTATLTEAAQDGSRDATRILQEALVERLRLSLREARAAHIGAYNAHRAAVAQLAATKAGV